MKEGVESLGRVRAQGIALLLLTFVAGILVGLAAERVRAVRRAPRPFEPGPEMVGRFREGVMPSMFRALGLTAEQREQIAVIMESGRPRTEVVLDELRAVTDSIRQEIRAVLTAEQAAALDSLETDWRRRLGQVPGMMPGRRGGPSRPPRQTP